MRTTHYLDLFRESTGSCVHVEMPPYALEEEEREPGLFDEYVELSFPGWTILGVSTVTE